MNSRRKIIGLVAVVYALCVSTISFGAESDVRLAEASRRGDRAAVQTLLKQGADGNAVNAALPDGTTALHWAVRADDVELTDMLIRARANVAAETKEELCPPMPVSCRFACTTMARAFQRTIAVIRRSSSRSPG